jgi:hypothetical protein
VTLEKRREYEKLNYYANSRYIIDRKIRTFFRDVIKRNLKQSKYEKILGYTILQFRFHIEQQFSYWMNWNNFGLWQIDHRIPRSEFEYDSMELESFKICWGLPNLRPLCKSENNKRKRGKYQKFKKKSL